MTRSELMARKRRYEAVRATRAHMRLYQVTGALIGLAYSTGLALALATLWMYS